MKLLAQTQSGRARPPGAPASDPLAGRTNRIPRASAVAARRASEALAQWATRINSVWARGAANTLQLVRVVYAARRRLARGEWSRLWKFGRASFSKRKGDMLATIGKKLERLNEQNSAQLPSAWNTLYFLSLLGLPLLLIQIIPNSGRTTIP